MLARFGIFASLTKSKNKKSKFKNSRTAYELRFPSSDWGKIIVGDTRIDIWGGFQQPMRLLALGAEQIAASLGGGELEKSRSDILDTTQRFITYKLAPSVSIPLELLRGKTIIGQDTTPAETLKRISPLVVQDAIEAYRAHDPGAALVITALAAHGVGANTYKKRKKKRTRSTAFSDVSRGSRKGSSRGGG